MCVCTPHVVMQNSASRNATPVQDSIYLAVAGTGFPRGAPVGLMQNLLFQNIFPENCMKMKGIGPSRPARVLSSSGSRGRPRGPCPLPPVL